MGKVLQFVGDSLTNLVSALGTGRDKNAATAYVNSYLNDSEILAAYRTAWLPRKIIDIPAFDSTRAWRNWQAKANQIEIIEEEEKRLNVKGKVYRAKQMARLWGGAALMIGTGGDEGLLKTPFDPGTVGKGGIKYLTVLTRRFLTGAAETEDNPESPWFGLPKTYTLKTRNGQQLEIHPSRLVMFNGQAPMDDDIPTGYKGWGDSVLQSVLDSVKMADSTAGNIASMVFEAKVDIIKLPDFMANVGDANYRAKVTERYSLASMSKGINGTLLLDKEEEHETKGADFAYLPEVLDRFLQIVAGAADIPLTRLLGQSPAGMNATGESDLRNYYDRLSSMQELEDEPVMRSLDEALIRSAIGARDPSIYYEWAPLWGMSEVEKANVFSTKATAARTIAGTGGTSPPLIPIDALSDALVTELIEDGTLSGLEAAIEEYGRLSEQEEDPVDEEAALGVVPPTPQQTEELQRRAANDAAPRSLYIHRDLLNGDELRKWAAGQGFTSTLAEDDMHVTVCFSRDPVDWMKMGETWGGEKDGKLTVPPGGPRIVEKLGPSAVVLLFGSSMLAWRHEDLKRVGASSDYPDYQPHITISYTGAPADLSKVEPFKGELRFGPEIFSEVNDDYKSEIEETRL